MTKEQKAKELISKIKFEGSYSDWIRWIGDGMEEYAAIKAKPLVNAVQKIADWQIPETGKFWDKDQMEPMSYAAAYGSNGERDYMRGIAKDALASYAGSAEGEKEQKPDERYPGESDCDIKDAIILFLEEGSAEWEERAKLAETVVEQLRAAVRNYEENSPGSMKASVLDPLYSVRQLEPEKKDPWISQELAVKILKIRDELVKGDIQEAYHILYSIADPKMEKFKPWAELEKIASEPPAATNQEGGKK